MLTPEEVAKLPSSVSGLRTVAEDLRADIGNIGSKVQALKNSPMVQGIEEVENREEAVESVKLAYRHLEDAKMRLGKLLEAADGRNIFAP